MGEIDSDGINGAPVYDDLGDVEDLSKPWFIAPKDPELCTQFPAVTADGWPAGWVDMGATEEGYIWTDGYLSKGSPKS
jgi:hypothetical protein